MKTTDLMIGDWVHHKGKQKEVFTVRYSGIELIDEDCAIEIIGFRCHGVEPIPLTAEILEKNGFERNEYFDYNGCTFFSFPIGVFTTRSGFGIEKRDDEYYITDHALMPMRYVHELQHALRLCGLGELANNFKI